ncbi:putative molybdopterin binding domain protein [Shigella flexneri 1235-66]|nr:putative molybdopterin binding domain protein [Shigella flexneri 1235-66]
MLNVEMLSTGDEVLHGQIVDTNAAWLADFFFNQGLPLTRRNTVGDNLNDLVAILRERSEHADVLIVNGGLGPTSDDLSALAAATAKGEGLVLHEAWLAEMARFSVSGDASWHRAIANRLSFRPARSSLIIRSELPAGSP